MLPLVYPTDFFFFFKFCTSILVLLIQKLPGEEQKKGKIVYSLLLLNDTVHNYKLYILRLHILCMWGGRFIVEMWIRLQFVSKQQTGG